MPRIRTIKPEYIRSYEVYALERRVNEERNGPYLNLRAAYPGLWTAADREGRFKWRPEELKLDALPHDPIDFREVLEIFQINGKPPYIIRYEVKGKSYGWIVNFKNHQVINNREQASVFPPPPKDIIDALLTRGSRVGHAPSGERKGKEGKGKEEERKGKESHGSAAPRPRPAPRPAGAQKKLHRSAHKGSRAPKSAPGGGKKASNESLPAKPAKAVRRSLRPLPLLSRSGAEAGPLSADRLAKFLRNLILANDAKARVPSFSSKAFATWVREAKLLIGRDKRPLDEAIAVLRWALDDEFWKANILSFPKFRKQYTQLKLNREREKKAGDGRLPCCAVCQVKKPPPGLDLCQECARCSICGVSSTPKRNMKFAIERRTDGTRRAICWDCRNKMTKGRGHPGLTTAQSILKENIS